MNVSFLGKSAALALLVYCLPAQLAAQDSVQVYELSPDSDPSVFAVVEYWSDNTKSASHPVSDVDLSFSFRGNNGNILDVLTAPNGMTEDEWIWEWFSADIDVVADGRMFREGWGNCSRWEEDLTYCVMDGDGGGFMIEREIAENEIQFHLILGQTPEEIKYEAESGQDYRPSINVKWPEEDFSANMMLPTGTEGRVTFVLPLYD